MGYYDTTRRLGEQVWFSGYDVFEQYNADCIYIKPLTGPISANYAKNAALSGYRLYYSDAPIKTLEAAFYVGGESVEDAETNVSKFIAAAKDTVIYLSRSRFEYAAVLTQTPTIDDTEVDYFYHVTLRWSAIKRKALQMSTLHGSGTVENEGTEPTGVRISLQCSGSHDSVNIMGVTISNVEAGKTYVIDGINGDVTVNDQPYLKYTTLYKFPKLDPGENTVEVPSDGTCILSWYPIYT